MKFSEKYPSMHPIIDEAPDGIIRVHEKQPCWNCGELTDYMDINYEAPLCSEECQKQKDLEYIDCCLKEMDDTMAEWQRTRLLICGYLKGYARSSRASVANAVAE